MFKNLVEFQKEDFIFHTHIVNAKQSITGFNAIYFKYWAVWSNICHNQRVIASTT